MNKLTFSLINILITIIMSVSISYVVSYHIKYNNDGNVVNYKGWIEADETNEEDRGGNIVIDKNRESYLEEYFSLQDELSFLYVEVEKYNANADVPASLQNRIDILEEKLENLQ